MSGMTGKNYRHEYKYRIDPPLAAVLEMRAAALLTPDVHAGRDGGYLVRSLYFDDCNDSCFWENSGGYDGRAKYRIRCYNGDVGSIRLEKKSKRNGMSCKESEFISEELCRELMTGRIPGVSADMPEMLKKLLTELRLRCMSPRIIVTYERRPYVCGMGNVRVTFDRNIASSGDVRRFLKGEFSARPILPMGESLMEVKWDSVMPEYVKAQLELDRLQWISFSKYYLCRKYDCRGGMNV